MIELDNRIFWLVKVNIEIDGISQQIHFHWCQILKSHQSWTIIENIWKRLSLACPGLILRTIDGGMVSKFSQIENTLGDFNIICFQNPGTELIMRLDILCLNWTIYCKMQERLEDSSKQWGIYHWCLLRSSQRMDGTEEIGFYEPNICLLSKNTLKCDSNSLWNKPADFLMPTVSTRPR